MAIQHDLPILNRFEETVRNLLSQIDPLLISVKGCAEVAGQVNELADRLEREQRAVSELRRTGTAREISQGKKRLNSLNKEIDRLYEPFPSTEQGICKFLRNLMTVLNVIPTEPAQLLNLRAEIERLEIWESARSQVPGMRSSLDDLEAISQRLEEMLDYLPKEQASIESPQSLSNLAVDSQPEESRQRERGPDIETSRQRIELEGQLITELTTIAQRVKKFTTVDELRRRYPDFTLWDRLSDVEQKELLTISFKPKAYARHLVMRVFGITSPDTRKKDRKKLRDAAG